MQNKQLEANQSCYKNRRSADSRKCATNGCLASRLRMPEDLMTFPDVVVGLSNKLIILITSND